LPAAFNKKFYLRNSTLGLLFIYAVNIHDVQCDAIMDVVN